MPHTADDGRSGSARRSPGAEASDVPPLGRPGGGGGALQVGREPLSGPSSPQGSSPLRAPTQPPLQQQAADGAPAAAAGGEAGGEEEGAAGPPPLVLELGVTLATLERLFTAGAAQELGQPVWMVVNLQGKIKGSYTADKMMEFARRGTLSAEQLVLGIDRDLPYALRQDLAHYSPLGRLVLGVHAGGRCVPLSEARAPGAGPWSPVAPAAPGGGAPEGAGGDGGAAEALRGALERLFTPEVAAGARQAAWMYINHLGTPFAGVKLLHAHLCGRLPSDTLVVGYDPAVPELLISGGVTAWFRPLGPLLENVAQGYAYSPVGWSDLIEASTAAPAPSAAAAGAAGGGGGWRPLAWAGEGAAPPLLSPGELGPPAAPAPAPAPGVQGRAGGHGSPGGATGAQRGRSRGRKAPAAAPRPQGRAGGQAPRGPRQQGQPAQLSPPGARAPQGRSPQQGDPRLPRQAHPPPAAAPWPLEFDPRQHPLLSPLLGSASDGALAAALGLPPASAAAPGAGGLDWLLAAAGCDAQLPAPHPAATPAPAPAPAPAGGLEQLQQALAALLSLPPGLGGGAAPPPASAPPACGAAGGSGGPSPPLQLPLFEQCSGPHGSSGGGYAGGHGLPSPAGWGGAPMFPHSGSAPMSAPPDALAALSSLHVLGLPPQHAQEQGAADAGALAWLGLQQQLQWARMQQPGLP
ncbi:MAG: hypothetical protein J3K34DRAFT_503549 [Monoraphidium minutum]|nr:MAG: hypothetical protein J3K34DRAFT_503549 [Monoraphidium minutum]